MPPRDPDDQSRRDEQDELDLRAVRAPGLGASASGGAGGAGDDLRRLGDIVRSLSADDLSRDEPPLAVWQGIAARTGAAADGSRDDGDNGLDGPDDAAAPDLRDAPPPPSPPVLRAVDGGLDTGASGPRHRSSAPAARRRRPWGLAAAAVLLVVLLVGGVALARRGDDGGSVVASAELEPLPDEPTGAAVPVRADLVDKGGNLQLDLSSVDLPAPAGFYEVWLIDENIDGMVSLGPERSDGIYVVPRDVDPGAFPIVDVSVEPPDGDPTHSGVSVLRGTLA